MIKNNKTKRRKQYLKENDERTIQITRYGQATGASIFLLMLPAAIIISGYFNPTVCITCLVVTFGLSLSMALGKIIYSKNTTLEKGYIRSKRFINEFNKKLGLNIDIKFIDEIRNGKCKTYK